MNLVARARVVGTRPIVRALLASKGMRTFVARRRGEHVANGLDPEIAALLGLDDRTGDSRVWKRTPAQARAKLIEGVAIADDMPEGDVAVQERGVQGAVGPLRARLYAPRDLASPSPGLVFFHGGGFVTGDLESHDTFCRRLALEGELRVVAVDYRLAPEHRFPAAFEDAVAAFRAIVRNAGAFGLDGSRVGIAGDSAGGNLSAGVALATRGDAVRPALQLLLYAALDGRCALSSHTTLAKGFYLSERAITWYYDHYLGPDGAPDDPRVSPLLAPSVEGVAPAIVAIAGFDPLRDESEAYVERLAVAGVRVSRRMFPSLIHGFTLMTGICSAARAATNDLARDAGRFLRLDSVVSVRDVGAPSTWTKDCDTSR